MQRRNDKQTLWGFIAAISLPPAVASILAMVGAIQALPLLVLPILVAAYIGGLRPGLVAAAAASLTAGHYLLIAGASPAVVELARCGALLVAGSIISVLVQKLHAVEIQPVVAVEPVVTPVVIAPAAPVELPRQRTYSIPMPMVQADNATLHDLNNALAVISGNIGLIAETFPVDHPDREMIADIETACVRAAAMTRKLARERSALNAVRERRSSPRVVGAA